MRCEDLAERLTDLMEVDLAGEEESAALEHLAMQTRGRELAMRHRNLGGVGW